MSNLDLEQQAVEQEAVRHDEADSKQLPLASSVTASEISKSWTSFESNVPLTYLVAARKAAREKNS